MDHTARSQARHRLVIVAVILGVCASLLGSARWVPQATAVELPAEPSAIAPESVAPRSAAPASVAPRSAAPESVAPASVAAGSAATESAPPPSAAPASVAPWSAAPVSAPTDLTELPASYPASCGATWGDDVTLANELLANRWRYPRYPVVTLPANRTWVEDPLASRNWQYVDHSLQAMHSLFRAYAATGDTRYRNRASAVLMDWVSNNPRTTAPSVWAWNDMATAFRAIVLVCATTYLPRDPWLQSALVLHGRTLADPAFFHKGGGNHALNQMIGLLEVAHLLKRTDWTAYALQKMSELAAASIDSLGATNEQSVGYQHYNYVRYGVARQRIVAMGLPVPAAFARIELMPRFLAHATLPNGEYDMLGDTDRQRAPLIPGTWAEFAATQGASGPRPPDTVAVYRAAGFLFARTGWGDTRPFADEVAVSLRFGPKQWAHGHADHGSVTMYGAGSRLLTDPGKYTYNLNAYRTWFVGRSAHNTVTVDGVAWNAGVASALLSSSKSPTMVAARVRMTGYAGVTHIRGVTFSRNMGYLLVDDRLTSTTSRTYRQLWHLTEDARPYLQPWHFHTQRTRGNVQVRQLTSAGTTSRILTGRTSPIQGWLSYEFGARIPAPVVEFRKSGANVRFLTLVVPAAAKPASGVSELKMTSTGYSVVIAVAGRRERVVVDGSTVSITRLP